MTDIEEILEYWKKKYPNVYVSIWPGTGKIQGIMRNHERSMELSADTIGDLISQGESFLRESTK